MRSILLTAMVSVILACGEPLEGRLSHLVTAKDKWESIVGVRDYRYEAIKYCYCSGNGKAYVVNVVDGQVMDAREGQLRLEDSTMRDHFTMILEMTNLQHEKKGKIRVVYNEDLGYPQAIVWKGIGFHSELTLEISNVTVDSNSGT